MDTFTEGVLAFLSFLAGLLSILHLRNAWVRLALQRLLIEAEAVVREVRQTYTDEILKARADGVLTLEEKAIARRRAIEKLKSNFGVKGLRRLAHIFGVVDEDDYAATHVEAALDRVKHSDCDDDVVSIDKEIDRISAEGPAK